VENILKREFKRVWSEARNSPFGRIKIIKKILSVEDSGPQSHVPGVS
jgi:hypothetical protein